MSKENFEESMKKLENIVTELENGNLNLDESVKKFEEGMKIAKQCGLEVCLSMTVGKHNVNEIEAMKKFASVNGYQFLTHFISN